MTCGTIVPAGKGCSCDIETPSTAVVHSQRYNAVPVTHPKGWEGRTYGVELEYDKKRTGSRLYLIKDLVEITGPQKIWATDECSVDEGGVEIVTHPFSVEYHRDQFPWLEVLERIREDFAPTGNCGMHVHLGITSLTPPQALKMGLMIYSHQPLFRDIARRSLHHYSFSKRWGECLKDQKNRLLQKKYPESGRNIVAFRKGTIEFRFPASSTDYVEILGTIEILDGLADYVKFRGFPNIVNGGKEEFVSYVKKRYPIGSKYLDKIGG
jgi:hypothetical protein